MKKCLGCGAYLQNENQNGIGYVADLQKDYCKRCFRMIHYDEHVENDFIADNEAVMEQLSALKGQFVWIIDIFDLETSLTSVFKEFFSTRSCYIILNKCDVLPKNTNFEKLADYVLRRIKKAGIQTKAILTRGINDDFVKTFDSVVNPVEPCIMCGLSNVGKSTVINHLLGSNRVTVNHYPATTINVNEIITEKYHFFDTVGVICYQSIQPYLENMDLKKIMMLHQCKPVLYQIYEDQSFSLGGLLRMDISDTKKGTIIFHNSSMLSIHRTKTSNAQHYWNHHFNEELSPAIKSSNYKNFKHISFIHKGKCEYFVCGLGFIQINSPGCKIDFYLDKRVQINKREAML